MILSVSSKSVGTKRRAIVIIMAISWTRTWSTFSGFMMRSRASVNSVGVVVKVSTALNKIRLMMRIAIKMAFWMPFQVICIKPKSVTSGSPDP